MKKKESFSKDIFKWLAVVVILAAFICALGVNFGLRAPIEAADKTIGILVDYDELKRIADGSHDIAFSDMLRKASLSGATGLVVRERLLADWEIAGDILVYTGGQLRFQLEFQDSESAADILKTFEISPEKTYILTKDYDVYQQIFSMLEAKRRYPLSFDFPGYFGIEAHLHSSERATLGLGFPVAQLEQAAAEGYQIIPRLRNWEPVTADNVAEVMRWVAGIPNLAAIGFNDQSLPGDLANPILLDRLADAISSLQVPLVSFEFYDQVGLSSVASRLNNNLLRVHAISENELQKYADVQDAMDRYALAATERNIRYIYLRFQGLIDPAAAMLPATELIEFVRAGLTDEGLRIGNPSPIPSFTIPFPVLFIIGAGVIAAGGWLLALAGEPFFTARKWRISFAILLALAVAAWAGGLILAPLLARKLFALAGAIFFPSLGVILVLGNGKTSPLLPAWKRQELSRSFCSRKALLRSIIQLLTISVFTAAGGMIMSSLLAEPAFMLKTNSFFGVKAAHIVPLALVLFILWLREEDWFSLLSGTARNNVRFWQLGVCFLILAALAIYILRTGNDNQEVVFDFEMRARQMLDSWLGVRPRTTEFLIGHPLMLITLYYGYRFNMFPLLMVGLMGQVSLINTYAHIHTPIMISLQRSGHGLWIGMVIGIILIIVLEFIARRAAGIENRKRNTVRT